MSTPQDTPDPRRNSSDGRPWEAPGTTGGASPHGTRAGGQYNYPSGAAAGYTYPGGGSMPPQTEKGPAPKEVMWAYYLILAAGVLYLLTAVTSTLLIDNSGLPGAGSAAAGFGYAAGIVIAAVVAAAYVVLAVFIRKGHNWARIVATVLAALYAASILASLLLTPLLNAQMAELGQAVPDTSAVVQVINVVVMLLGVAGVVMTYLKPARPYFAPRPAGF